MLITIAHQCCHSCKQAYLHSNASLRPALTEYRLIIMNHKWKQTMLLSPQNNYQLPLEIQFKQHAFELHVLYLNREKRQETNSDGTGITKMAMRTRYDVLRYSRTTWVICACVLLQKYNQQRNQNRIVHCPHQSKSQSRNPTSRNRWSERSFSWPPSPG